MRYTSQYKNGSNIYSACRRDVNKQNKPQAAADIDLRFKILI